MTITEFANRIHIERTTVYHIFKQKSIDFDRLKKISDVLNYDFITEIFQKKEPAKTHPAHTVLFVVELDAETLRKLNQPDEFLLLVKKRN